VAAATLLALVPGVASAEALPAPDRDGVMLWTAIVVIVALAVCAVGFAYRSMSGMDHPTPDEISMMGSHGHGDDLHGNGHGDTATHAGSEPAPAAHH
jgi:hypothetical protein